MTTPEDMQAIDEVRAIVLSKHGYTHRTLKTAGEAKDGVAVVLGQCRCGHEFEPDSPTGLDQQVTSHLSGVVRKAFKDTDYRGMPGTGGLSELSR